MMRFPLLVSTFFIFSPILLAINSESEGYKLLNNSTPVEITLSHTSCRKFTNTHASKSYFIPTRTADEYSKFMNNLPDGVTFVQCGPTVCGSFATAYQCSNQTTENRVYYNEPISMSACKTQCQNAGARCCYYNSSFRQICAGFITTSRVSNGQGDNHTALCNYP